MSYDYPSDMYRSYTKSILLEVERRLDDRGSTSPYVFSKIIRAETDKAMRRMIQITGTLRRVSECPDLQPDRSTKTKSDCRVGSRGRDTALPFRRDVDG